MPLGVVPFVVRLALVSNHLEETKKETPKRVHFDSRFSFRFVYSALVSKVETSRQTGPQLLFLFLILFDCDDDWIIQGRPIC